MRFQRKQLQVDSETMEKRISRFGPELKRKIEVGASKAMLSVFVKDAALTAVIIGTIAACEAVETSFKFAPILGSIVGASLSSGLTHYTLTTALDAHKELAMKTIDVVNQLSLEK